MKKQFGFFFIVLMMVSNAFASNCHELVGKKIIKLSKEALINQEISSKDMDWVSDIVEVAVSKADGNNYSCSILDSGTERTSVSVIILRQKDVPLKVRKLIIKNDKLLSSLVSGLN